MSHIEIIVIVTTVIAAIAMFIAGFVKVHLFSTTHADTLENTTRNKISQFAQGAGLVLLAWVTFIGVAIAITM